MTTTVRRVSREERRADFKEKVAIKISFSMTFLMDFLVVVVVVVVVQVVVLDSTLTAADNKHERVPKMKLTKSRND